MNFKIPRSIFPIGYATPITRLKSCWWEGNDRRYARVHSQCSYSEQFLDNLHNCNFIEEIEAIDSLVKHTETYYTRFPDIYKGLRDPFYTRGLGIAAGFLFRVRELQYNVYQHIGRVV